MCDFLASLSKSQFFLPLLSIVAKLVFIVHFCERILFATEVVTL